MEKGMLKAEKLKGFWQDMGSFDGLLKAGNYWYGRNMSAKSLQNVKISKADKYQW